MKYLSILSLITLIIVISGCIGQTTTPITSTKDGVVITDLSFEHSPVYAGDYVGLGLEVQNIGGSKATLTKIQVYGVDFNDAGQGSTAREWGRRNSDTDLVGAEIGERELDPPSPDIDLEGAKYYYEWRLQAPSGVTSETDYDFRTRVEYKYETTYSGTVRVMEENYLQSLSEDEKQKLFDAGGVFSSELTNGPLTVTPYSGRHFIVDINNPPARIMKFKVENVGKGYPFIMDNGEKLTYHIRIKQPEIEMDCTEPEFKLSRGESYTISCVFAPPGTNEFTNKIDKPFQITFEYYYYVDGRTSIKVIPTYEEEIVVITTTPITTVPPGPCKPVEGTCMPSATCESPGSGRTCDYSISECNTGGLCCCV